MIICNTFFIFYFSIPIIPSYPTALKLISEGHLPGLKDLVTHHFDMKDTEIAFNTAMSRDQKAIKVMVHCN